MFSILFILLDISTHKKFVSLIEACSLYSVGDNSQFFYCDFILMRRLGGGEGRKW
jgi:hypothetical protein